MRARSGGLGQLLARSILKGRADPRRTVCRCLEERPVLIPKELLAGFHRAAGIPAPFGDGITVADHCLQMATEVHRAEWVPNLYRRDMVVMSLFHDIYFTDSQHSHGEMTARLLEGRIHPHVLGMLRNHTHLGCGSQQRQQQQQREQHHDRQRLCDQFAVSTHRMLDPFAEFDCHTVNAGRSWLPLEFFEQQGYFRAEAEEEATARASWLSPNGTLIWAAPSMWIERTPILLAKQLGLFEAAGLPSVELTITDGGPELLKQVREGRVHVAEIGLFPFLAAMDSAEPPPASLVGSTFIQQLDHYLAAGDPEIRTLEHLQGRRVGVLSKGSCDSYLLQAMLKEAGVDPQEVEAVPLGGLYGSAHVLQEGHVDATFLVEPALSHAEVRGIAHVLSKASSLYPRFQWGGLLASKHIQEVAPDVLLRVLEVYKSACGSMHRVLIAGTSEQDADFEVLRALREIGPRWFNVSEATFLKALGRDAATWQLDWRSIDFAGAEACASIQRDLGVFSGQGPSITDAFAANLD